MFNGVRFVYTEDVGGSSPSLPTIFLNEINAASSECEVRFRSSEPVERNMGKVIGKVHAQKAHFHGWGFDVPTPLQGAEDFAQQTAELVANEILDGMAEQNLVVLEVVGEDQYEIALRVQIIDDIDVVTPEPPSLTISFSYLMEGLIKWEFGPHAEDSATKAAFVAKVLRDFAERISPTDRPSTDPAHPGQA